MEAVLDVQIDHFVWGVPDLAAGIDDMAARLGAAPIRGGAHPGMGTQNALLSLGPDVYLEVIAPADELVPQASLGQRLQQLSAPGLITWVQRTNRLDDIAAAANGMTALGPLPTQRQTPQGTLLSWELLFLRDHPFAGLMPFFIDWQETPHPASTSPAGGRFLDVRIASPQASELNQAFEQVGLRSRAEAAQTASLAVTIAAAGGETRLASTQETLSAWVV